jgi:gliding motility-associated-like protein
VNFQPSPTFNLSAGSYTITVRDGNGCLASTSAVISLDNTVTVDAGLDTSVCSGRSYLIPATSNASSFSWSPSATLDNPAILQPTASPTADTWYYITATEGICTRVDSMQVRLYPSPVADAGTDQAICYGKTVQLNGSGGVSYQWSPLTNFTTPGNIPNPSVKALESISYFLTVTDIRGCVSLQPDEVRINVTPAVKIFAGRDTVVAMNQPLQLAVTEIGNAGVTSYIWTPAFSLNDPFSATPVAILTQDQQFMVTGSTPEGCEGVDHVMVKVYKGPDIYVPSGFTPNNDGRNDVLRAIPVGIREFRYFQVFNRWGQLIFSTRDPRQGWDGRISGVEQPTGTYVWIAEAIDYKGNPVSRKGFVTIIR